MLKAPYKEMIWFENSAHVMVFSNPDYYQKMLIEKVLVGPDRDPSSRPETRE